MDQYLALLKSAPGINAALRGLGQAIGEDDDEDEVAPPAAVKTKKTKKDKSRSDKANIDATSDEED